METSKSICYIIRYTQSAYYLSFYCRDNQGYRRSLDAWVPRWVLELYEVRRWNEGNYAYFRPTSFRAHEFLNRKLNEVFRKEVEYHNCFGRATVSDLMCAKIDMKFGDFTDEGLERAMREGMLNFDEKLSGMRQLYPFYHPQYADRIRELLAAGRVQISMNELTQNG